MNISSSRPCRWPCVLLMAALAPAGLLADRLFDAAPGPAHLPGSGRRYVQFHFTYRGGLPISGPNATMTAEFQRAGSRPGAVRDACRIQIAANGEVRQAELNANCLAGAARVSAGANGTFDATVAIAFLKKGRYDLYLRAGTGAWNKMHQYEVDQDASPNLSVQIVGVTNTQAVLSFTPPAGSDSCTVQVTSTQNDSGWDYSTLVPDTDTNLFDGAGNADVNDPAAGPGSRGFVLPDGTRAIVIGKRSAEYSPYTFKMHSRALQVATPHEAWVTCGDSAGIADFTTANIMTGVSYQEPLPADPDRPGEYAYPTVSWTSRTDAVIDPQTGLRIVPVTLPQDAFYSQDFADWQGFFGVAIAGYPARSGPAKTWFLPANLNRQLPPWFNFIVDQDHPGWSLADYVLSSFLPASLTISCPQCSDTPVTICLTADGISCAVDRNVSADPNAATDPNTGTRGVLGTTINCTGVCSFPADDGRWSDTTPILAAWHPNYSADVARTVVPSFQADSVKLRSTPVSCSSSALVYRAKDGNQNPQGAPFNSGWKKGTPLFIDNVRYTVNQVTGENSLLLNESCPSSAKILMADTFGLLIVASVPMGAVAPGPWKTQIQKGQTYWDASGDLTSQTNCSHQSVQAGGQAGWHCTIGSALYWIAADGSRALPLGVNGIQYRPDLGYSANCSPGYWDDLDGNTVNCMVNSAVQGQHTLVRMTFYGDHAGLENGRFNSPDTGRGTAYLPTCTSTNPPAPNNCWKISPMNETATNSPLMIENAIRAAVPDLWNNSAFAKAALDGAVYTSINSKLDDNHLQLTTWLGQNSYGFTSILELSMPRGSAKIRAVLPSWAQPPNAPPGVKAYRWAGIHDPGAVSWGPSRVGYFPTNFRAGGTGQGPYYSNVVGTSPAACPSGISGACISVTLDGQPGNPSPSKYEPVNDGKTGKRGFGYLQDLAPGDVLCAPQDGNYFGYCSSFIPDGHFEHLRVLSSSPVGNGTVTVTLQRNLGQTGTRALQPGQQLFAMPTFCDYTANYGCGAGAVVWDWSAGTVDQFLTGGEGHQFTGYDPVNRQVVNVAAVGNTADPSLCYTSSPYLNYPNCYGFIAGPFDSSKPLSSQTPAYMKGLITMNPPSGGLTGMGTPNDVDSHPGAHQMSMAPDSEKIWFVDGRPFNGFYTSSLAAPVQTAPGVYKFSGVSGGGKKVLESYKRLPVLASCGFNVLRDVTQISDQTPYTFCVAVNGGDCTPNSSPGDSFISCPTVDPQSKPGNACPYAGIGNYTPEVRDTCLTSAGPYTMGLTQVGFAAQVNGLWKPLTTDQLKRSTRLLTRGLARYRIIDQYWNPKTTPDGGVLLFRSAFVNGYSTQIMMAKIPPFPDITQDALDRRGFVPVQVPIDPGPAGATSVKMRFGYDPSFRCISRNEACEARADFDPSGVATPFYFASEGGGPDGLNCLGKCFATTNLPGISQRVMYYQPVYQVNNAPVYGTTHVLVVP